MESARGEVEAEDAVNGRTDLTSTGQTDGVAQLKNTGEKKKKVIRARRLTSEGDNGRESPQVKSCRAPRLSDLWSRKHLQIQQE